MNVPKMDSGDEQTQKLPPQPTAASEAPTIKASPRLPKNAPDTPTSANSNPATENAETLTGKTWRVDPMLAILYLAIALVLGFLLTAWLVAQAPKNEAGVSAPVTPTPSSPVIIASPAPQPTLNEPESIRTPRGSAPADIHKDSEREREEHKREDEQHREAEKRQEEREREREKREAERERERNKERDKGRDDDD
jgi:hypothetical protein